MNSQENLLISLLIATETIQELSQAYSGRVEINKIQQVPNNIR
jgi:hypothetical protein